MKWKPVFCQALMTAIVILCAGCVRPATGPIKGVLVVYDPAVSDVIIDTLIDEVQIYVATVDREHVFNFSTCRIDEFKGDLRTRRTILFVAGSPDVLPDELEQRGNMWVGKDVWASGQDVYGVVMPGFTDFPQLSGVLEESYNRHLHSWIYTSFVATRMTSPERIDSLLTLGFSFDIPKSYHLSEWDPDEGFIQYQRNLGEDGMIMLSVRWIEDDRIMDQERAVLWREMVARRFFFNAAADSVDRSRLAVSPMTLHGASGWKLLGMWRNPEHLNAGAFVAYVLRSGETRFLIDAVVFHESREKEIYIREGLIIMNTFIPDG